MHTNSAHLLHRWLFPAVCLLGAAIPPCLQAQSGLPPPPYQEPQRFGYRPSNVERLNALITDCNVLSRKGLTYLFGSMDPARGGLDCSGTMQWLLRRNGAPNVPRTASDQYVWLQSMGQLQTCGPDTDARWIEQNVRPGDLLFWRGTYATGRVPDVSHVMIYVGRHPGKGTLIMFGSSSRTGRGLNGSAVDFYEWNPGKKSRSQFLGFGHVPGLSSAPLVPTFAVR